MTNKEYSNLFDEHVHSAQIKNLFRVAASFESREFHDFLEEFNEDQWNEMLPDLEETGYFNSYFEAREMHYMLADYGKFGFIANVNVPHHYDFIINDGEILGCKINEALSWDVLVYAESIEELDEKIKAKSDEAYQKMIEHDKSNKKTVSTTKI